MKIANRAIAKTIMRKKNFLSSTPVLPLQEISYDGETTMQSRYIINQLKANLGTYYEEETVGNLKDIEYTLEFKLNPVKSEKLGYAPYLVDAAGGKDGIELIVNYEPSSYPQFLNDLIAELKDTLRHELEHVGQENFEKGVKIGDVKNDANLPLPEYLTLDYEIPAFIRGLNKKAKTKDITLGQAIDEFFLERADELSYGEEAYVKRKWVEWIKKNLPKTPLNENFEGDLQPYINSLTDYMGGNGLTLKPHPAVEFINDDRENAANIFGKTAYYMPSEQKIALYVLDRHPKDILRSYAHELVHHHQNLNNTLEPFQTQNTNEDGDLERIEREAYENGNIMFRNWEDSIKNTPLNETFSGDSNPLNLKYIDDWHNGQYKAQEGKTEEAIKLMTTAADDAEKLAREKQDGGMAGEANYYRGTIAWLKKDYSTVQKYINDKFVKITGNDEVLKRLLKNKDKSYKEACSK